ncbi:protein rolling stone-like [Ylistrum balloti]|uniref:protein rolling stone-like n=1 Tax=Ylistrum balloti TaxID=509963 RepID=UPI002905A575|nr:protein rolling stone-like [Ylistrum balloti]
MACNTQTCKEEFQCKNLGLGHTQPRLFVSSQCGPTILYPIWTIFWLVYRVVWIALEIYWDAESGKLPDPMWMVFLTNWAYLLLHIASTWDFVATHVVLVCQTNIKKGERDNMPWYLMISWVLFNIQNAIGLLVTLVYYIVLDPVATPSSINKHAMNSVFIFINFFLCAKPVRILHFYQVLVFIAMYGVFSLIYQLTTDYQIYSILDWYQPWPTLAWALGLGLVGVPLAHSFFFGLYNLRTWIFEKCCSTSNAPTIGTGDTRGNTIEKSA